MPPAPALAGQLNAEECRILTATISDEWKKPQVVLEIGTWLGGGSTLHFLKALEANGEGHLWGVEADRSIYERMIENIRVAVPEALHRFTPLFGFSQQVIPRWLAEQGAAATVDVAFLDGGDNPLEQITEFQLLADRIPVRGHLLAHDAKLRKGKWLLPYLRQLDNWKVELHDVSVEGLLSAEKLAPSPSAQSRDAAAATLRKLKREPAEMLGRILPSWLCALLLKMMPTALRKSVSQGR